MYPPNMTDWPPCGCKKKSGKYSAKIQAWCLNSELKCSANRNPTESISSCSTRWRCQIFCHVKTCQGWQVSLELQRSRWVLLLLPEGHGLNHQILSNSFLTSEFIQKSYTQKKKTWHSFHMSISFRLSIRKKKLKIIKQRNSEFGAVTDVASRVESTSETRKPSQASIKLWEASQTMRGCSKPKESRKCGRINLVHSHTAPWKKWELFVGRLTCFPIKNGDVSLGNVYLRVFGNTSNSKVPHFRKTPGGYFAGLIMFGHFGVLKR